MAIGAAQDELVLDGGSSMMMWKWQLKRLCNMANKKTIIINQYN